MIFTRVENFVYTFSDAVEHPQPRRSGTVDGVGENGTGKSTVLQATALALLGAQSFMRLANAHGVHPRNYVRYECPFGTVSVKLSGFPKPHTLTFHTDRVEFTSPADTKMSMAFDGPEPRLEGLGWEPQALVLGYGATRLLPRLSGDVNPPSTSDGDFSRVDNLFNPFVPLLNAENWLLGLDKNRFDNTATVLRDLLALPTDAELIPEDGHVVVIAHGAHVPLHQLSDGYQSVVAMTADLLQIALHVWPNLQDAEGSRPTASRIDGFRFHRPENCKPIANSSPFKD